MSSKTKLYLLLIIVGWVMISGLFVQNQSLRSKNLTANTNLANLNNQLGSTSNELWELKTDFATLQTINDSITKELAKKADKNTERIIYKKSVINIHDTIRLQDTIPAELIIDTTLTDKWRSTRLKMRDTTIAIDVSMCSELTLIQQKERIIPKPKKTWLGRLFQRKVTTHKIYIQEENPYIYTKQTRWWTIE